MYKIQKEQLLKSYMVGYDITNIKGSQFAHLTLMSQNLIVQRHSCAWALMNKPGNKPGSQNKSTIAMQTCLEQSLPHQVGRSLCAGPRQKLP